MRPPFMLSMALAMAASVPAIAAEFTLRAVSVDDTKAVIATVEPQHQLVARARIGGTVTTLRVKEGDRLAAGAEIAVVADPKLALQRAALDQRIRSQEAQRDQARNDFERIQELQRRGVSTLTQLEQARTVFDVAERNLSAIKGDRGVLEQQMAEGAVLAPGAGRVLSLGATEGRVVMPGETIVTMADDRYMLRLQLPERHAQFMRAGDTVQIGARGQRGDERGEGRVRIVYPEIQGGRVIADVEVASLGNYFVGERVRVFVPTGKREALYAPETAVFRRAGVHFVKLKSGAEVVVQPGDKRGTEIEILSGLRDGDVVIAP